LDALKDWGSLSGKEMGNKSDREDGGSPLLTSLMPSSWPSLTRWLPSQAAVLCVRPWEHRVGKSALCARPVTDLQGVSRRGAKDFVHPGEETLLCNGCVSGCTLTRPSCSGCTPELSMENLLKT